MTSTMEHKPALLSRVKRVLPAAALTAVWAAAAYALRNPLLLPSPVRVVAEMLVLLKSGAFWTALSGTFCRILLGFFPALISASLLSGAAHRWKWVEYLLSPCVYLMKAVPVASYIVAALLWLSSRRVSSFIAFLMAFPLLYTNLLQSLASPDREFEEVAAVFRLSPLRRWRYIVLPSVRDGLLSGTRAGLGLCWKAGIAAEVLCFAPRSVGGAIYSAKVSLETAQLFAWTLLAVCFSAIFEALFLLAEEKALCALEGR